MNLFRRFYKYVTKIDRSYGSEGLNLIGRRRLWYLLSSSILVPATLVLIVFGLRLGIDFTGGAVLEVHGNVGRDQIAAIAKANQLADVSINSSGSSKWQVRYKLGDNEQPKEQAWEDQLKKAGLTIDQLDQVGPSVSRDLVKNAFLAIGVMSLAIVIYITIVFRRVPKGVRPLSFGLATLFAAFLHDALFVLGIFAILGRVLAVEVDTYIVTALLTVIGFSIHDTVVVFDRIREKLAISGNANFSRPVNDSVNETFVRSLNTSVVIVLVLLALFLFGGASTRYFVLALLLGMVSGTYSSIFIAAPLLVTWQNRRLRKSQKGIAAPEPPKPNPSVSIQLDNS